MVLLTRKPHFSIDQYVEFVQVVGLCGSSRLVSTASIHVLGSVCGQWLPWSREIKGPVLAGVCGHELPWSHEKERPVLAGVCGQWLPWSREIEGPVLAGVYVDRGFRTHTLPSSLLPNSRKYLNSNYTGATTFKCRVFRVHGKRIPSGFTWQLHV